MIYHVYIRFAKQMSSDESMFGPDIYDIVERLHELNIAFSYQFRDMQTE